MSTINKEEIQKFSDLADEWWDVKGKFKPLHMFNPIRIEYILGEITKHFKITKEKSFFSLSSLKCFVISSKIYSILMGLNLCKGLNLPFTSHHSSANFENF